jgi:putative transferase (TIGR04331 family)
LPKPPRVIFTNTLLHRSEQFKLWSATFVSQGKTKLLSGQHGGGYKVTRFVSWGEEYESSVVDKFLSWGEISFDSKVAPACVQSISESFKPSKNGDLIVVLGPITRNSDIYGMLGVQSNSTYFRFLDEFVFSLSDEVRSQTIVRPKSASQVRKPARVSSGQAKNIFSTHTKIDGGEVGLNQRLKSCRLAVVTYNETTIPTNIMNGFPTIALWDPKYVRLNSQAELVYHQMHETKILFYSPQLAAEHITQIWSDVEGWWNSPQVRLARENYCNHYAHRVRFPALTVASVIADNL